MSDAEQPDPNAAIAGWLGERQKTGKRRVIPNRLIGLDDTSLSLALLEINNAAKRQRDLASADYRAGMHGLARTAKSEKELLYELKDDVLSRLIAQERARVIGYHSKPDPRETVRFIRRPYSGWYVNEQDEDEDEFDEYSEEYVAVPARDDITVNEEGYPTTYLELVEFCGRHFHRPIPSLPNGVSIEAKLESELSPSTTKRHARRKDAVHTLREYLNLPDLLINAELIVIGRSVDEGRVVEALSIPWIELCRQVLEDERLFFEFAQNPRKFEEFVAGAYKKSGFAEVILTPRSNDLGRDIIAIKPGEFSIRIIDQCKAYSPHHKVTAEEVRAMLGVLFADRNATKAIVTTTATFAPGIDQDIGLTPFMPHRLELRNGKSFRDSLRRLYPTAKLVI